MKSGATGFGRERAARTMLAIDTVSRAVQAKHLQTYLDEAQWVDPAEEARTAARRLQTLDFDQAPAREPGRLLGYVLRRDLAAAPDDRPAGTAIRALDAEHLVSAGASVLEVLEALTAGGAVAFVVVGRDITGFVTVPDLNKHEARTHFYPSSSAGHVGRPSTMGARSRALSSAVAAVAKSAPRRKWCGLLRDSGTAERPHSPTVGGTRRL